MRKKEEEEERGGGKRSRRRRVRGNIGNPCFLPVINHRLYSHLAESKYGFEGLNITQCLVSVLNSVIFSL